jgi:hypothetical protein
MTQLAILVWSPTENLRIISQYKCMIGTALDTHSFAIFKWLYEDWTWLVADLGLTDPKLPMGVGSHRVAKKISYNQ